MASYLCRVLRLHSRCQGCSCPCHDVPEPVDAPAYTAAAPGSGTIRMPKVTLPEGYEPPSAAVLTPAVDLQYRQLVTSWRKAAEELAAALYGAVGVHPELMQMAPIANAVEMWEGLHDAPA